MALVESKASTSTAVVASGVPAPVPRVPLELPVLEDDKHGLSDTNFEEMRQLIVNEAASLKSDGKLLSPRREQQREPTLLGSKALKNVPVPKSLPPRSRPVSAADGDGREAKPKEGTDGATAVAAEEEEEVLEPTKPRFPCLPYLRCLFDELGREGRIQADLAGLAALCGVSNDIDRTVIWRPESEIERRIRQSVEAKVQQQQEEERAKKQRQKELMESQREEQNPHAVFMANWNKTQTELKIAADRDRAVLNDLDAVQARAEKAEKRKEQQLADTRALIQKRKEEREARIRERQEHVAQLQDDEEELRDQVLAANRVRYRFDKVKDEVLKGADVSKLDDY